MPTRVSIPDKRLEKVMEKLTAAVGGAALSAQSDSRPCNGERNR